MVFSHGIVSGIHPWYSSSHGIYPLTEFTHGIVSDIHPWYSFTHGIYPPMEFTYGIIKKKGYK